MPAWMLGASAILLSPFLRELAEMRFQWDRPYHVDASRSACAFWVGRDAVRNRRFRDGALVSRRAEAEALKLQQIR
jgi:hypothetical protein